MTEVYDVAKLSLGREGFSAFRYLAAINTLLSNPVSNNLGRDLIVRALDAREQFSDHTGILRNMVRKSGLFPYLKKEFTDLTPGDRVALDLYRTPFSDKYVFHSMQFHIFDLLKAGSNLVLSAPTSMGKSAIVDSLLGLGRLNRVVLVVPTVALADETRRRLQDRFGEKYQIIHHSSQVCRSDRAVYVLTQERVNERDDIQNIDLFVIDEFYKLAFRQLKSGGTDFKDERVIELNIALSKLLKVSKQFYLTGPFVNSIRGLTELGYKHTFISADFNTVAVDVQTFGVEANDDKGKLRALAKIAKQCEGATIVYCKSSGVAGKVARELIRLGYGQEFKSQHIDWVAEEFDSEWDYTVALKNGIGLHFGGLPRALQQYTADRFNAGDIRFLLCTSTIIEGVNTVAKNVVIYDNRDLADTLRSWIEEAGTTFRSDLALFYYYLWENDVPFPNVQFNPQSATTSGVPLLPLQAFRNGLSLCEEIYFDILVERLGSQLEHFNPNQFITMYLVDAMDGFQFEAFLVEIFQTIGYDVKETKKTADQGADLFVTRFGKNMVIQAKNYSGSVGNAAVQQAISAKAFYGCDEAMVVTNSYYTKSAKELAGTAGVRLIDRDGLQSYLDDYNQKLIEVFQAEEESA